MKSKTTARLSFPLAAALAAMFADVQTASADWLISPGATTGDAYAAGNGYDYDATANWSGGTVNDNFSTLGLTGPLTISLDAARTTVAGGLNLTLNGNTTFNLYSDSATSRAITLGGNVTADVTDGSQTITIGTSARPVTLNLNNDTRTFTVGSGDTLITNGVISSTTAASGLLTKAGTGVLTLNAANTYTGTTTVNGGELRWGITNALLTGDLTVNSGGTVNMNNFTDTVGTITLNRGAINISGSAASLKTGSGGFITTGGTVSWWPGIGLGGNFTYNTDSGSETTANIGAIDFNGANRTFTIANGVQVIDVDILVSLYDATAGNRNFIKAGPGTMRISGGTNMNYNLGTGTTSIQDGVLILNKTGTSTAGESAVVGSNTITVGDSTGAASSAILRYASTGGNDQIFNNPITILSDGLFDLNGKNETTSGAVTLNSTGQLDFNGGTLSVGAVTIAATGASAGTTPINNTAGTGGLTVASLAITPVNGFTSTISLGSSGTLTLGGDVTFNAAGTGRAQITGSALALGGANRTFTVGLGTGADYDLFVGAGISGARSLTKAGTGRLVLTGNNNYTLGTTVNAGTLQIGDGTTAGTMASSGALTMGGGTFGVRAPAAGGSSQTVGSLATTAGTVSTIKLTPGTSGDTTLTITSGTLTTGAGSTVNFDYSAGTTAGGTIGNNYVVWNPTLTDGIIGVAYTVTDSGGTGFATTSGGNVVRLADSGSAGLPVSGGSATNNYFVGSGYSTVSTTTPGSLIEALSGAVAASTVTVDTTGLASGANLALGTNLLTLGTGMVFNGANPYEITGSGAGGLTAASAGGTIFLNNYNTSTVTISAPIVDNSASRLTVNGTGTTILAGVNTYTGVTNVTGTGTLQLGNAGSMGSSTLTLNSGATLKLRNDADTVFTAPIATAPTTGVTYNFDVNQATVAGTGRTLSLGNLTFATNPSGTITNTINVTGGNGYTLGLGTISSPSSAGGPHPVIINATTAAVTISKFATGSYSNALTLQGGNAITLNTFDFGSNSVNSLTVSGSGTVVTLGSTTASGRSGGSVAYTLNSGNTLNLTTTTSLANVQTSGTLSVPTFTINGGTLNNTNGSALTLAANGGTTAGSPTITIGGSFAFGTALSTSANNLNLGAGAVTNAGNRTVTLNGTGTTLTMGSMSNTSGTTQTTTVNGAGNTLVLGGYSPGNSLTGVIDGNANVNITGAISSSGNLTYGGSAKLTLTGDSTHTGFTTVSSGVLAIVNGGSLYSNLNNNKANAITINSGGTIEFDNWNWDGSFGQLWYPTGNFLINGGTLRYVGTTANGSNARGFTISANGATLESATSGQKWVLISAAGNTTLASNGGTLTLTGAGDGQINQIIPGGGGLTKSGNGTWTLAGTNSYTGATSVNQGTLLVNGSTHANSAATVGASGTLGGSGTINGTVSVTAGGTIRIGAGGSTLTLAKNTAPTYNSSGGTYTTLKLNASAATLDKVMASATTGNSVANVDLVIDTTGLTGNVTSTIIYQAGGAIAGPFHSVSFSANPGGYAATLDYTTSGQIKLSLASGGSPYEDWAGPGVAFNADANGDGVSNGLAWLLGAATPGTNATGLLPTTSQSGGNLVMSFTCLATVERGTATLKLEYDGNLAGTWLNVPVPGAVGAPNPIVENTTTGSVSFVATDGGANGNGDALITVVATISDATESASGKLFGRLKGTNP